MQYILTGFTQDAGFRVFGFEGVGDDRSRDDYRVKTDLSLIRKYGIRVQDLPLLCRGMLERRDETLEQHTFTYSETEMRGYASVTASRQPTAPRKIAPRPVREAAVAGLANAAPTVRRW
jgi:hypothetical protein